jgi:hypothetical protein
MISLAAPTEKIPRTKVQILSLIINSVPKFFGVSANYVFFALPNPTGHIGYARCFRMDALARQYVRQAYARSQHLHTDLPKEGLPALLFKSPADNQVRRSALCMLTSRIVQACSAVQLFVRRCLRSQTRVRTRESFFGFLVEPSPPQLGCAE